MGRRRKKDIYILCKHEFGNPCNSVLLSGRRRDEEERRGAQKPLSSDSDQTEALALLS
jgi:3'-phosphoadenosine 5'-phosphosulfate sulfotransferase (PAPS reductase)/FAD synthetase